LDAFRARAVLLFVAIAITLASLSSLLWAPQFELKLEPSAITPELGLAYTTPLPQPGRAYIAIGSARLPQLVLNAILLADAAIIFLLRRWILALLVRHRRVVAGAVVVGACSAAAMLAFGAFGVVNPTGSPPSIPAWF
jgi:hypothetical protein